MIEMVEQLEARLRSRGIVVKNPLRDEEAFLEMVGRTSASTRTRGTSPLAGYARRYTASGSRIQSVSLALQLPNDTLIHWDPAALTLLYR